VNIRKRAVALRSSCFRDPPPFSVLLVTQIRVGPPRVTVYGKDPIMSKPRSPVHPDRSGLAPPRPPLPRRRKAPLTAERMGLRVRVPVAVVAACATALAVATDVSASYLEEGEMIIYEAGEKVAESELVDLGPPESLGATVLDGDPKISARIDYAQGGLLGGVFQATRGKVRIDFPFTEHATILNGEVELTDQWGNHARLEAGDSYFITQGSLILWEVRGPSVQKTFFNRRQESGSPAPMVVYRARHDVPDSELTDLGSPESLGGTVLSGDPKLSGRIDYGDGTATAGVFQATRGDAQIRFPFAEHATIIEGAVTLTDQTGEAHRLDPGDSYLIKQDSSILWQVAKSRVQKSFFNIVES
jgi:uncharacterized cupin superfamily protein